MSALSSLILFALLIPVISTLNHYAMGGGRGVSSRRTLAAMVQSVLLPGALFQALNYSDEGACSGDDIAQVETDAKFTEEPYSALPTITRTLLFDGISSMTVDYVDEVYKQPEEGAGTTSVIRGRSHSKKTNIFCEQNCASRSYQPSNPDGRITGASGRW
jgi:hypothetical protein